MNRQRGRLHDRQHHSSPFLVLRKHVRRLTNDDGQTPYAVRPPAAVRRLLAGWCLTSAPIEPIEPIEASTEKSVKTKGVRLHEVGIARRGTSPKLRLVGRLRSPDHDALALELHPCGEAKASPPFIPKKLHRPWRPPFLSTLTRRQSQTDLTHSSNQIARDVFCPGTDHDIGAKRNARKHGRVDVDHRNSSFLHHPADGLPRP